jgi:hypothetical protein
MDKNKNNFLVINKRISKYAKKSIIKEWQRKSKLLINKCNSEKLSIDTSKILYDEVFFQYLNYLPGAYKAYDKLNTPIYFIAYDMCILIKNSSLKFSSYEHTLIFDIAGNTIRGVISTQD